MALADYFCKFEIYFLFFYFVEKNQNLLSQWNEKALHMNWNQSNSIKVEEWLKDALDDEEENNFNDDDFDESSIEIIDH